MLARVLLLSLVNTAFFLWLYAKVVLPLDPLLLYFVEIALAAGALIIEKLTNCLAGLSLEEILLIDTASFIVFVAICLCSGLSIEDLLEALNSAVPSFSEIDVAFITGYLTGIALGVVLGKFLKRQQAQAA